MIRNPDLLKSRLDVKEKQHEQKGIIVLSGLMFMGGFIVSGLDFRFGWSNISITIVIIVSIIFLLAYVMYAEVLRENTFLSRTIQVKENQTVIDTGLYGIVRHPMYISTLCLFLTMPLILGSLWGFLIFLMYPFIIIKRIKNEELVLEKELMGYIDYERRVPYKLIPYIW